MITSSVFLALTLSLAPQAERLQAAGHGGGRTPVAPPAGEVQALQLGGPIPSGFMILGETEVSPPGYTFAGLYPLFRTGASPAWSAKPDMPFGAITPAVVQVGTNVYVIGGNQNGYLNSVWRLDLLTCAWFQLADMPTPRSAMLAAEVDGVIYVIGGEVAVNTPTAVVEAYHIDSNTWNTPINPTDLPAPRAYLTGASLGGKIYAVGGIAGSILQSTNAEYDPLSDTWTLKAPMLNQRSHMAAAILNGHIHILGGWNGAMYVGNHETYDPVTNTWSTRASLPVAGRGGIGAVAANARIYAMGGQLSGGTTVDDTVLEYEPLYDAWYGLPPMPTPRSYLGAAASPAGVIYAIAGLNGGSNNKVEAYESGFRMLFAHRKN